jgi:hypothetical protein
MCARARVENQRESRKNGKTIANSDDEQNPGDQDTWDKLARELEFILRATMETSPDDSVDLTELAEHALIVSLQCSITL